MNPLRVLIVDDEPLAREGLAGMVKADPELLVAGVAADGRAAVDLIRAERPDLVFLDVQMPQLDGFSVLAELSPTERPMVVFVTAYEQHAIRAFEVSAVDYLLKPFSDSRFAAAVARAKAALRQGERPASASKSRSCCSRSDGWRRGILPAFVRQLHRRHQTRRNTSIASC